MPTEPARRDRHLLGEFGAPQRRHRIAALARALEDVAAPIDDAADVAGLSRYADLEFDLVVTGFDFSEAERPIIDCRALRNARSPVASRRFAHDLEVPRIEAPTLRPIMQRGAADRVHHRMDRKPWRIGRRGVRPMRRNLAIGLLGRLRPAAEIVAQLVWRKIPRREPRAGLNPNHFEPGAGKRQGSHAADRPKPDNDD